MSGGDRTRVKPGERDSTLPVVADTAAPEAYRRAPTLLAGAAAGQQGEVKVWAPERGVLLGNLLPYMVVPAAVVLGQFIWRCPFPSHSDPYVGALLAFLSFAVPATYRAIRALHRPLYLTTDAAGIGITTRRGSRALLWSEIMDARFDEDRWRLQLRSREWISLDLLGHSLQNRGSLRSIILRRAGWCHRARRKLLGRGPNKGRPDAIPIAPPPPSEYSTVTSDAEPGPPPYDQQEGSPGT